MQIHFFVHVRRAEFPVHLRQQKISCPGGGQYFVVFSRDTSKGSIHELKTTKRSKSTGNKFEKQKRWRPKRGEIFFAVAIWQVTGQGFQSTKWPTVLYSQ